jgi:hypothetical protein
LKTSVVTGGAEGKTDMESLQELDRMFLTKLLEWGKVQYAAMLEEIDRSIRRVRDSTLRVVRRRAVWYRTCLGSVRVERTCYQGKNGGYRYLLDEILGMGRYHHTTAHVTGMALGLAVEMTFRRAAGVLRKLTAASLSHQTIHNQMARAADPCLKRQDRETGDFREGGVLPDSAGRRVPRLMVEADGVVLSLQRERARRTEVKLGIAYEGWAKAGRGRYRTVNKTFFADTGGADGQWAGMMVKLQKRYDMGSIPEVIVGGDGASWVRDGADDLGARFQLCRYHLNRELCFALGQRRDVIRAVRDACHQGQADVADAILAEISAVSSREQAVKIEAARRYIKENAAGLGDYRSSLGDEGKGLRRLGAIEGNVDKLIVRRMKNQGMNWKLRGIRRLLCIRFLHLEGRLDEWLRRPVSKAIPAVSKRVLHRQVDRALKRSYHAWLDGGLPALTGPHAFRPWVINLRQLSRIPA